MFTIQVQSSEAGTSPEFPIKTLNEASAKYRAFISENGLGSSGAGSCYIRKDKKIVAHVSYNGKVWPGKNWQAGAVPIFDPSKDL